MSTPRSTEIELMKQWNTRATQKASLRLVATDDDRTTVLRAFVDTLTQAAPRVEVVTEAMETRDLPALVATTGVHYHAAPEGNELAPFLDILSWTSAADLGLDESVLASIARIDLPAELKLYVTPQCPFCPAAVRMVAAFAFVNPRLQLSVIDGLLFPELSQKDGIRSVPTLILDDAFRWTGTIGMEEVLDALTHRDMGQLSAKSLENILKEGNAQRLAEMMLRQERIFPAFPGLLEHSEWSVRLGAMVVVEELAAENPSLARQILRPLWEDLANLEDPVKGDILYLFGLVGSSEWIPPLESLLATPMRAELREVLEEALEALRRCS